VLPTFAAAQPGRISIELSTANEFDAAPAGSTHRVALDATLQPQGNGLHVNSNEPLEDFLIPTVLTLEPPEGISLEALAWPTPIMLDQQGSDNPLAVFEETFVIGAAFTVASDLNAGNYSIPGSLRYQACDERMCYIPTTAPLEFQLTIKPTETALGDRLPAQAALFDAMTFSRVDPEDPQTPTAPLDASVSSDADTSSTLTQLDRFSVLGSTGGYLNEEQFLEFIQRSESGEGEQGWFEGRGPLAILALILIGGLALNLTPCVLPMIPINLAIIGAGAQAGSRQRGFALGTIYGLAMALVYGILGLVVILTAGTFGTVNASPWFNLGIAVLFVVLALAMFDVFNIDFSRFQERFVSGSSQRGSFLVAFGMGSVAALLAGACVAPVVIQVIVFSSNLYATGTTLALALPFVLGIGMAIPWPIAGAGLSFMPKPGPWMVRVKQAFGVFIVGTAVYYGALAYDLFAQRWVDPTQVSNSVQELIEDGWYPNLSQGLAAAESEDRLILVDVWATWCKNCLTMDQTTLKAPGIQDALNDYVKVKFQAEDLGISPAREVMERFDAIGLPAYAILRVESGATSDSNGSSSNN
tara:strand:- start:5612 stop:7366 length:1755 start_codon:yes stop_codon:yes gene_type:complete